MCWWKTLFSNTKHLWLSQNINKKTQKPIKMLKGTCSVCNRSKSIIVSNQTIEAEGLGDFFRGL